MNPGPLCSPPLKGGHMAPVPTMPFLDDIRPLPSDTPEEREAKRKEAMRRYGAANPTYCYPNGDIRPLGPILARLIVPAALVLFFVLVIGRMVSV